MADDVVTAGTTPTASTVPTAAASPPEPTTPPAPKPTLIQQYELDEHPNRIETPVDLGEGPPSVAPGAAPAATPAAAPPEEPPPRTVPQRDPATGRFVSAPEQRHSRHMTQLALDLGFTQARINSLEPEALQEEVYWANRQRYEHFQNEVRQQLMQTPGERPLAQGAPPPAPEEEVDIDWGEHEGRSLRDEDIAPGLVKIIKDQQRQLKRLEQQVTQDRLHRAQEERWSEIDQAFAKHADVFGVGRGRDMDKRTPEFAKRLAVLGLIDGMGQRLAGTMQQRIDEARKLLYGEASAAAAPPSAPSNGAPDLSRQQAQWLESGLARPTSRASPPEPPGTKKAEQTAARFLRDNNIFGEDLSAEHFLE